MKKEKTILLFSDLEGTILRESDGQYSDEEMFYFLQQIDKLQSNTDSIVKIHLVSPIYKHQMENIINKIDKNINSYNNINKEHKKIYEIECGGAYPDENIKNYEFFGDKVFTMQKPINSRDFDSARYGKAHYVQSWIDMYNDNESKDLIMCIYCGNGRNDLKAMSIITQKDEGFVVCPKNSRHQAQELAFYTSEKEDLPGITEGIEEINKKILEKNGVNLNDQTEQQNNSQR